MPVIGLGDLLRAAAQLALEPVVFGLAAITQRPCIEGEQLAVAQDAAVTLLAEDPLAGGGRAQLLLEEGRVGLVGVGGDCAGLGQGCAKRLADLGRL